MHGPRSICILGLLVLSLPSFAQGVDADALLAGVELEQLDFSAASIHQAGPASFYIRSVVIDGAAYSFALEPTAGGGWSIATVYPEDDNLLPPETVLDFALISLTDSGTLRIDGVFVDGRPYGGALSLRDGAELALAGEIEAATVDDINQARAAGVRELVLAASQAAFGEELERQRLQLQEAISRLERERDELAGNIVGLIGENNEQRERIRTLADQIESLQTENGRLLDDVQAMTAEVDRLRALVEEYRSAGSGEAAAWSVPGDYVKAADFQAAAREVTLELRALESRIAALETAARGLSRLQAELRAGVRDGLPLVSPAAPVASEESRPGARVGTPAAAAPPVAPAAAAPEPRAAEAERLAALQAQVAGLLAENDALRGEQRALEARVLTEILENGLIALMEPRLTRRVIGGFAGAAADTGSWTVTDAVAVQTDPDAFFAKAAVPVRQEGRPYLYRFTVRSLDDGWVGVGLHLFVEDTRLRRGFGMGSSLLVWLTRDPAVRKSNLTYLQLYRSDDDVNMERVLDAVIEEPISSLLDVQVLYEPDSQYLTVAVNGQDKIRYRTWFGIDSGVEIALRSLGRAEFSRFAVFTSP